MTEVKLVSCDKGHRSTVPVDAVMSDNASTYTCPICGTGVTRTNYETIPEKTEPPKPTASHQQYRPLWAGD